MNLNRYQWTAPFLKSVPHFLDAKTYIIYMFLYDTI